MGEGFALRFLIKENCTLIETILWHEDGSSFSTLTRTVLTILPNAYVHYIHNGDG